MILRVALLFCGLGFSSLAFAAPAADATTGVFGVAAGIYRGAGVAVSNIMLVPDIDFVSLRKLENGVITAETRAKIWGMEVAKLNARLKIVPTATPGRFQLLDLDKNAQPCGSGVCSNQGCTFAVTVMNGDLSLKETWVPTANGFELKRGSQVFNGLKSTYEAPFTRVR